ncbi:MAG: ACT domain-containing protein, partial [Candidatus Atribacteria bacterium]|nr:ACT domain-containing protein [Candidatus Atribacteria bacterium]
FDMVLPFGIVGFLAKVSKVLADEKILIFAISAYSTDHILVKEKDLIRAEKKLKELGCTIEEK